MNQTLQQRRSHVDKEQAPYVRTKPLRSSQRPPLENEDGSITIRFLVSPNYKLEQLI